MQLEKAIERMFKMMEELHNDVLPYKEYKTTKKQRTNRDIVENIIKLNYKNNKINHELLETFISNIFEFSYDIECDLKMLEHNMKNEKDSNRLFHIRKNTKLINSVN